MRYQIYEAKSVKYDAQQRVGMTLETAQTYMNTVSFVHPCIHEIFDTGLVRFSSTRCGHEK